MTNSVWVLALSLSTLQAEVVDRIAIAVGRHVITQTHLETEIRVTAFVEGAAPKIDDTAIRRQAAARLIQQTLIRREIELTRFPMPKPDDAQPILEQVRAGHGENFAKDLAAAGLDAQDLADHLLWQLTLLRFVQYRFQPGIQIGDDEVKAYYDAQLPRWAAEGRTVPPLESMRKDIESLLTHQRVDQALDRWLAEQREQTAVTYRLKGLAE
jgi:hypothetical protein